MANREDIKEQGRTTIFSLILFAIPYFGRRIKKRLGDRAARKDAEEAERVLDRKKQLETGRKEAEDADNARQKAYDRFVLDRQEEQRKAAIIRGEAERRIEKERGGAAPQRNFKYRR